MTVSRALAVALLTTLAGTTARAADTPKPADPPTKVSYYKDIRPIFAQHCNGCHQPAKPGGGYVTTGHADLLKIGEREKPGVVPGKPAASYLVQQITPHNGKTEMPRNRDPLTSTQRQLISDWITQGATDDTPPSARAVVVDRDHPPRYSAPPVVTNLAYSSDGKYLAVTGYHEVLVYNAADLTLAARLIGISERINAVAFSPDGKRLAAVGGSPGRFGEVQIWDHTKDKLILSVPVTFDTLYGVSWSPDGKLIAFGCADNTVRAIEAITGKQVLQMGTHSDWALGTVFSQEGLYLASVSRDMSMKLTDVTTQRFIDNITSITPGQLKGGLMSIDRRPVNQTPIQVRAFHTVFSVPRPKKMSKVPLDTPGAAPKLYDELLAAGSDGMPRLYKMHREIKREIGDDSANPATWRMKVREYKPMPGRVSGVAFSPDGKHFAAASSLDGKGEVRVYVTDTGKELVCEKVTGPAYAVTWQPNGKVVASAGFDGTVWIHDALTGKLLKSFVVVPPQAASTGTR